MTVGLFKHRTDGKTLALITDRDYRKPTRTKLSIQPAGANVERINPKTKQWSPAELEAAYESAPGRRHLAPVVACGRTPAPTPLDASEYRTDALQFHSWSREASQV